MSDTSTPPGTGPSLRTPLWMRVLLILSLGLNLLIVGALAGAIATRAPQRADQPRDLASSFYLGALPREDRRALLIELRREAAAFRENRAALRAEVEATIALLRAEPFDPVALGDAIGRQRGRLAERSKLGDRVFVGHLAAMSPAERAAYADRLEETLDRRWWSSR